MNLKRPPLVLTLAATAAALAVAWWLWVEHGQHLLAALPLLVALACPLMHWVMHRGHGHGGHRKPADRADAP